MRETFPSTLSDREERSLLDWEETIVHAIQDLSGEVLIDLSLGPEMPCLLIHPKAVRRVVEVLRKISDEVAFPVLLDITAVDYLQSDDPKPSRFAVVWHLLDHGKGRRLRIKAYVEDGGSVPSLTDLFPAANWAEREVFDMMGIGFTGHPDLTRILMPDDYEGHPQRKDFPIQGPERGKRIRGEMLGSKPLSSWKELHEI
jgi:NADH/F420H2 dehydrogenase subunit C